MLSKYFVLLADLLLGGFGIYLIIVSAIDSESPLGFIAGVILLAIPFVIENIAEELEDEEEMGDAIAKVKRQTFIFTLIGVLIGVVVYLLFSHRAVFLTWFH